ncbi:hypothetical protein BJF83_24215 [Nocardiopsis sp. CNR-923]|nr:hypothetical protein BJF83_24215 [Nocardiopsis sp. CNR-923]
MPPAARAHPAGRPDRPRRDDPLTDVTPAAVWAAVFVLFCAVIPMGFVIAGVRTGRWTNHHVPDRAHRRWPLVVGAASVAAFVLLR